MQDLRIYEIRRGALSKLKHAVIITSKGKIELELFAEDAPQSVTNFAALANSGFYNGLKFHRVISNFVAQSGCPYGNGTGNPGWRIPCELKNNPHKHKRGSLSMAHAGRDTGGSQFFLCFVDLPHLDGEHTVFGAIRPDDSPSFKVLDSIKTGDIIEKIEISQSE